MSLTLYELADRYRELQDRLVDDEVDEQIIRDTLASVEGDIVQKADNCAAVMRSLELEADAIRLEEVRLKTRRDSIDANRERLRRYVQFELEQLGMEKVKGPRFYLTLAMNPWKVNVLDEKAIPPEYWKPSDPKLDKAAILEALKAGTEVPGATKIQERSLRVR